MIYATARMTIPFRKLDEALEILGSIMQRTRFESGCVSCNVYRDVDSENEVMVEEIWKNEKDLARHLRSDEYRKVLFVAEMASVPPEIRFYTIQRSAGVETVEKARTAVEEGGNLDIGVGSARADSCDEHKKRSRNGGV